MYTKCSAQSLMLGVIELNSSYNYFFKKLIKLNLTSSAVQEDNSTRSQGTNKYI